MGNDDRKVASVSITPVTDMWPFDAEATVTLDDGTSRSALGSSKAEAIEKATDKAQRNSWF